MRLSSHPTLSAISMTSVITTVVWLVFATAGVAGLRLQYQQAPARAKEKPPVAAEKLDVKLIGSAAAAAPNQAAPVQESSPQAPPLAPSLPRVAAPSPAIPFAVPVNAPARPAQIAATVQHLVFGTGEGDKPAPEYPREARIARQQGSVVVRFTVDENGEVTDAEASTPSAYALLNQAAVRAVRETWHFPRGKPRTYDVTFQFELHQK
jgi:protein TonB